MTQWKFDEPHCIIEFSVRHWGVAWVKGRFSKVQGMAIFDEGGIEQGSAEITIDMQSIWTGNEMRDNHLRSKDFFNVEQFPEATFKTTGVDKTGEKEFAVRGDLIIRDITKPIVLIVGYIKPQEVPSLKGGTEIRVGFTGKVALDRHDFGLNWDVPGLGDGASMVGGEVDITISAEAVKQ
ncbi:MAG: YceI-like protein family protein [Candidatus Wolfebacteria bacterium GW2011_GWE1_48_7]|uniref:YceI-like protein family protein n=2 Tax=Candidatus Wolfeibacteriota TaxID=1752735 RepID=A0A0G1X5D5_9BACT|nr:MAG: YceI-like protein family protein [Candidatus Wolfebacteria bacterium GW2011_GWB1_47_1]KKU36760.1 MAG: YceI-like protein family protein [Candidatus Wolfebacteria bacterium GW2011_GWC2_46_275]KKU42300.1 MAG: YceI-like protein family protein [Candidatus Wolfebacteria bacterium GW2011_GWB2_46_69]KKU53694.1 MAG: YceI-like protein family protein [Candidatus Wolfebacteria bacterium GW2011_GWC1_47_103]KKU58939.1 MAG: YceI-like protein family protein [Candidatus Wolfebacteria bacterium GW2011_GW